MIYKNKIKQIGLFTLYILLFCITIYSALAQNDGGPIEDIIDQKFTKNIERNFNIIGNWLESLTIGAMIVWFFIIVVLYFILLILIFINIPIKIYPVYIKYQNFIKEFVGITK